MLQQIIKKYFPYEEIVNAYAYGSRVIPQKNLKEGKMKDLIFVVNDVEDFHNANRKINSITANPVFELEPINVIIDIISNNIRTIFVRISFADIISNVMIGIPMP